MTKATTKPDVLLVMPLPPYARAQADSLYTIHDRTHLNDPEAFAAIAPNIRAIIGSGEAKVPRTLMTQMPNLKMVSVIGVGYDGVDTAAANDLGIKVTHTPDVLNDDVADLAIGLMLCAARKMPQADQYVRQGRWAKEGMMPLARKVSGSRVGIVGMGRIGKTIAKRCAAFDMPISYTARSAKPELPFTFYASTKELAANVDFLVVITPGGAATKGMINAEVLAALGKEGYLINVARGTVVDQPALIHALQNNINRLEEDHRRAKELGKKLTECSWVSKVAPVEKNIVVFSVQSHIDDNVAIEKLKQKGIAISLLAKGSLRMVTHLDYKEVMHTYVLETLEKLEF